MSRLHEMKSKGLGNVKVMYSRSSFFGIDKTMQDVVDEIKERATLPTRDKRNKTMIKTRKATMGV